jgi:drug/metabolite transporter (DMT)-like permease
LSSFALGLILAAALCHATWNYVLKKSGGGIGILTLSAVLASIMLTPVAIGILLFGEFAFKPVHFAVVFGSGMLHTVYFLLLDRAYRAGGDLSIVYPLARATGPLLTIVAAVLLLDEHMSGIALAGALLIGVSALALAGNPLKIATDLAAKRAQRSAGFALLTGCMIAAYTVWDKQAVAAFLIPPVVFDWCANLSRISLLVPLARLRDPGAIARAWREQRKAAFIIGILSPLSYILVLTAMVFTPVSYVAPARELSILFAALMGAQWLNEGNTLRRGAAALGMVLGVSALALG